MLFIFYKDFIYLWETQRETEAEKQEEGEVGSMQGADVGLDPGSPGSDPGLKAALNRWATRAAQKSFFFFLRIFFFK